LVVRVTIAAEDVDELCAIRREPLPAVCISHFSRIRLIETHAGQYLPARRFYPGGETHAVGIRFDLRAGHGKHGLDEFLAVTKFGNFAQLIQTQLRRREHHDIDFIGDCIRGLQGFDLGFAYPVCNWQLMAVHIREPIGFRRDAHQVEQRNGAEAGHRRAKMLELIGSRRSFESFDYRHRPVIGRQPPDHAAEGAPVVQRLRRPVNPDAQCGHALTVQMEAIARRTAGESGRQRGRAAFKVGARAAYRVGINHHAGIAKGHMLAARWRCNGLVIDAGIRHRYAKLDEGVDRALFQIQHPAILLEHGCLGKISAARIGNGRDPDLALTLDNLAQFFQPDHTRLAQTLGVGHDVRLSNRDEVFCTEEIADCNLMLQCQLWNTSLLARQDGFFFVVQFH